MPNRPLLDTTKISAPALGAINAFHAETLREVEAALGSHAVVVVGMAQNPWVKKARRALEDAGIAFHYLEYGSYVSEWKRRLAIKMWSGWPTFPQVFAKGELLGGYKETAAAIASGELASKLAG